jgi:GTP-binding protein
MLLVASKCDVANKTKLAKLKKFAKSRGLDLYPISAVTGEGVEKLKYAIAEKVEEVRREPAEVSA